MSKDFRVIIDAGTSRAATFEQVFGRREVCVQSPIPVLATLPGFDEPQPVLLLDIEQLSIDELGRLVDHLVTRFGLTRTEVHERLAADGVPILASECSIVIENPQRWVD